MIKWPSQPGHSHRYNTTGTEITNFFPSFLNLQFSGPEHQRADWIGIHEKICQLLIPLRSPIPFLGSEDDRQHRKLQQILRQVGIWNEDF